VLESGFKDAADYARRKEVAVENAFAGTLAAAEDRPACPEAYSLSLRTALFPLYPRLGAAAAEKVARVIQTLP